jgi:transposase
MKDITYVGLDAHKKAINVAMLLPGRREPVEWIVENEPSAIRRMMKRVERETEGEVRFCYEAGPCGYALQRRIQSGSARSVCEVVAPALIPTKPGDRLKTDRRDARKLAEYLRADLLTEVKPPTLEQESVRDLCRCREDAKEDHLRARHRVAKMLLRRGLSFTGGKGAWTRAYWEWVKSLRFEHASDQVVFDDYVLAITHLEERIKRLDDQLRVVAEEPEYKELVGRLRCFRGIEVTTAICLVAELYNFGRFASPRGLMAYLGLVPSEHSSSDKTRRGGITKAGNAHARRLLIETSWHYRHRANVSPKLRQRRKEQPGFVIAIADKAQERLNRRYRAMTERGKPTNKVVVAIARELVGFLWAALQNPTTTPTPSKKSPSKAQSTAGSRSVKDAQEGAASGSLRESLTERSARRGNVSRRGRGTA